MDQAEVLRRAAEAAARINSMLGTGPGSSLPALTDSAHQEGPSSAPSAPVSEAAAQSLAVLQKYQQDFMNLKQEEQRQREEQRAAMNMREPGYIPRPFSPPRENTGFGPDLQKEMDVRRMRSKCLLNRHDHINKMLNTNQLPIPSERFRSPSPPPVYDPENGQRLNTREQRTKELLDLERRECIGEAYRINSEIRMPPTFRPALKEVKLFIPIKEHPGYNFIGLILGPRGSTQKRLENETGAKVTIRGKGSIKEGTQLKTDARGRLPAGWHEETHVHIAGDTWDKVDSAMEIVEPLLFPVDEERNVHKRKQLLELARINGTVRPGMFADDNVGQLMLQQQMTGPLGASMEGVYRLPEHMRRQVDDQYRRDVARAKGVQVESSEAEYQAFLQELGGGPAGVGARHQVHHHVREGPRDEGRIGSELRSWASDFKPPRPPKNPLATPPSFGGPPRGRPGLGAGPSYPTPPSYPMPTPTPPAGPPPPSVAAEGMTPQPPGTAPPPYYDPNAYYNYGPQGYVDPYAAYYGAQGHYEGHYQQHGYDPYYAAGYGGQGGYPMHTPAPPNLPPPPAEAPPPPPDSSVEEEYKRFVATQAFHAPR